MNTDTLPKISFGMIVLNGEPFVHYNLLTLYPFAHEIIIVEGAVIGAKGVSTADGHSQDSTLDTIHTFKANHDTDDKVILITKDRFWEEKDEMSQAYADVATGDYLWQVDSDEFYRSKDMKAIIQLLQNDPTISAVSFKMLTFWGNLDTITDGWYLRRGADIYHRLFKWGEGYQYVTHRPPTVVDEHGIDLRDKNWIDGTALAKQGIVMYHYSLLFPKQVYEKNTYYQSAGWSKNRRNKALEWTEQVYIKLQNPFRVHNVYDYPSWLERYIGEHPQYVLQMWQDIDAGIIDIERRPNHDINALLDTTSYQIQRFFIRRLDRPTYLLGQLRKRFIGPIVLKLIPKPIRSQIKRVFLSK